VVLPLLVLSPTTQVCTLTSIRPLALVGVITNKLCIYNQQVIVQGIRPCWCFVALVGVITNKFFALVGVVTNKLLCKACP